MSSIKPKLMPFVLRALMFLHTDIGQERPKHISITVSSNSDISNTLSSAARYTALRLVRGFSCFFADIIHLTIDNGKYTILINSIRYSYDFGMG